MVAIGKKLDAIEFIVAWTNCDKFRSRICEKYVVHTKDYKRKMVLVISRYTWYRFYKRL